MTVQKCSHAITILWQLTWYFHHQQWVILFTCLFLESLYFPLWGIISQVLSFSSLCFSFHYINLTFFVFKTTFLKRLSFTVEQYFHVQDLVNKDNLFASFKQSFHIISLYDAVLNRLTMIGWCIIAALLSWDKVNPRLNLGRWQTVSCGVTCYNSSKTISNSIILMILYYACSLWPHSLYGTVFLIHLSHHRTAKKIKQKAPI